MTKLGHDGRRYRLDGHRGSAGFRDLLKWQLSGKRARWPQRIENAVYPKPPNRVAEPASAPPGSAIRRC